MWKYKGADRPDFAVQPKAGQESVWDYPRPPVLMPDSRSVEVVAKDGTVIARAKASIRVLETASPPTFYLSPESLLVSLIDVPGASFCEWKGQASYFMPMQISLALRQALRAVYCHNGWYSFYASLADCYPDGASSGATG